MSAHVEEIRLSLGHIELAAHLFGPEDGLPVIALHGWLDNANSFARLAPQLKGLRLVALDLAGMVIRSTARLAPVMPWPTMPMTCCAWPSNWVGRVSPCWGIRWARSFRCNWPVHCPIGQSPGANRRRDPADWRRAGRR